MESVLENGMVMHTDFTGKNSLAVALAMLDIAAKASLTNVFAN